jgi:predicted CopG family antitoxin
MWLTLKNVKIPDDIYTRLTKFKGELTSDKGRNFSYGDTIDYLLNNNKKAKK